MSSFIAKISKGELDFQSDYNTARWHDFLAKNAGKYVRIEKIQNTRSLKQNSLYWVWLETIAKHTGHTPEELHRIFKGLFLPTKNLQYRDKILRMSGSTTGLTKGEFVEFMMKVEREAAELGITLLKPDNYLK